MTPDELDFLRDNAPDEDRKQDDVEHNWELLREGRGEILFSDPDVADLEEERQMERDRQATISFCREGY